MSRWSELAYWCGPTPNQSTGHVECRGLVVHIASGFYEGTISWIKNPDANVSSHFVLARDGRLCQMVDTNDTAWTQRDGNGHWLSVECEGFATDDPLHAQYPGWETPTAAQEEAIAQLLKRGHDQYGYPLTLAGSPSGKGLGYHSMGAENGYNWGHLHCPGEPYKARLPAILARAQQIAGNGGDEDDMGASTPPIDIREDGFTSLSIPPTEQGSADPRPAWLNVGNDTGGERYGLRLVGLAVGGWYPLAGAGHDDVVIAADARVSYQLKPGTYAISIVRRGIDAAGKAVPVDADHPAYAGHLTCCIERGALVK